ncbi:DNA-directed RNA polymerase, alpha subunit [Synechococcus sp. PCC 7335]|uniref:DNA-directed RNA polymerase subunit alpha n=1 Tax=Synechococcus sp. (strain ATCC 29403 / PCC 7335) TaxID=91464 RepID=UPI00017EE3B2|nr:DNA-directed RNA polymerase subunit alpha [Synechococcus sp. PCC 7335]EDX86949.1 DNA-directed RNA polymerase, alpha subunit [Synechococcus sp. PCC 7335]
MAQFQVNCVESIIEDDQSQFSRFVIEPLGRSQGTTVGNALRRVLLSNLEGTAVTSVRIAGASHEFSTIPGVREDVLDILLNMKETVLKSYSAQPQIGRLVVQGPAKVTAANFDLPSEVELISTDRYIASVAAGHKLEMEFRIERGKGYKAIDRSREETGGVEFMQIDAVFMPVRKVNYSVENFIDPEGFPKDRLVMEIWTNGSLTAQQAMSEAAALLVDMFNPLKDVTLEPKRDEDTKEEDPTYQIPIEELQLSVRAYNCLKRAQINAVSDLLDYSQEDLLEIKNFGQKSAEEVVEALQIHLGIMLPLEKPVKTV